MRGRYFRYLFENQDEGLFHSGSIYDKEENKTTNYIYMVGSYCRNGRRKKTSENVADVDTIPKRIDLLVVGGYTAKYIKKLINIVKNHEVETVILPYLAPIQRLVLVEETKNNSESGKESVRFLKDPYVFLKKLGIGNIYFLYKNGRVINREPEELEPGCHFELADMDTLQLIREMEGYMVPVVRAGYIVENNWLFYFGVYGLDIQVLSSFTREYFSHIESINEGAEYVNKNYIGHMKKLIKEYLMKFGASPVTTIAMFHGPLHAFSSENDGFLSQKEFNRNERCEAWVKYQDGGQCTCAIRCMHDKDHDVIQNHKESDKAEPRFGMLLLGNAKLSRFLSEIIARFWKVRHRIRGISVPNSGNREDWNRQILGLTSPKDRMYWICGRHEITSPGVASDIVLSSSNNRFLIIDENQGCCFAGYLLAKEDMD